MMTLPQNTKLSRTTIEFLVTIGMAYWVTRVYSSSPVNITMIVLCLAFSVPILLVKPQYSILFIAVFLPFRDIHIVSVLYLKRFVIWTLLAYTLLRYLLRSQKVSSRNLRFFNRVTLVFVLSLGISLMKAASEVYTTTLITPGMVKAAMLFFVPAIVEGILLLYIVYYSITTGQQIQCIVDISLGTSAIVALLGIWQYVAGGAPPLVEGLFDPDARFYGRATSVFSNPNDLGGFAALMVVLALVSCMWGTTGKKKRLLFDLPVLLLNTMALVLSFSRGGMVQVFFSMGIIGYLYYTKLYQKKLSWRIVLLALTVVAIAGLAVNYYEVYMRARIGSSSEANYQQALYHTKVMSDYLRKHVAVQALRSSVKHPLLGVGFNLFSGKYVAGENYLGLAPHNQFLKILVEMGLLGFIPFILMLVAVGKTGLRIWEKSRRQPVAREVQSLVLTLLSGVIAVTFGYLFTDSLVMFSVTGYLWVFSGAIFVLDRQYVGIRN